MYTLSEPQSEEGLSQRGPAAWAGGGQGRAPVQGKGLLWPSALQGAILTSLQGPSDMGSVDGTGTGGLGVL